MICSRSVFPWTDLYSRSIHIQYPHGFVRAEPVLAFYEDQPMISGFTPINRPESTELRSETELVGEAPVKFQRRKRKRVSPPPLVLAKKKPASISRPRKATKFELKNTVRDQDAFDALHRTKPAKIPGDALPYGSNGFSEIEASPEPQPGPEVRMALSETTMNKLASFKYQADPQYPVESHENVSVKSALRTAALSIQGKGPMGGPIPADDQYRDGEFPTILHSPSIITFDEFDETREGGDLSPSTSRELDEAVKFHCFPTINRNANTEREERLASFQNRDANYAGFCDVEKSCSDTDVNVDDFPMDDEGIEDMLQMTERAAVDDYLQSALNLEHSLDHISSTNDVYAPVQQHCRIFPRSDKVEETTYSFPKFPLDKDVSPSVRSHSPYSIDNAVTENVTTAKATRADLQGDPKDLYDDEDLDLELLNLTSTNSGPIATSSAPSSPGSPTPKLQWMPSTTYTPVKKRQLLAEPEPKIRKIDVPHLISFTSAGTPIPFIRPQFPTPIRDRSPIAGLIPGTVLRTCFRIGEALNAASHASRTNATTAIIELYARVVCSFRPKADKEGGKQHFQFADIFTSKKPPFLSGTYACWRGVELWDCDSRGFLGEEGKGKLVRVLGRIKRGEKGSGCEMVILSVWEVGWADVGAIKGIVCSR